MKIKPYFNLFHLVVFILILTVSIYSCGSSKPDTNEVSKINFNLDNFTDDGAMKHPHKEDRGYISYEFCIPADDEHFKEVSSIDSTLALYKTSKGRSACSDKEWLCIGSSHQPNFKKVILALAKLSYIRKINETFWE